MARIWVFESDLGEWLAIPVAAGACALVRDDRAVRVLADAAGAAEAVILRADDAGREAWVLLAPPGAVLVNGAAPVAGMALVSDRDEIRLRNAPPIFLALELTAAAAVMPDVGRAVPCRRCTQEIAAGTAIVRCPRCEDVYHETAESPCWSVGAECATCGNPTVLGAVPRWSPAEI